MAVIFCWHQILQLNPMSELMGGCIPDAILIIVRAPMNFKGCIVIQPCTCLKNLIGCFIEPQSSFACYLLLVIPLQVAPTNDIIVVTVPRLTDRSVPTFNQSKSNNFAIMLNSMPIGSGIINIYSQRGTINNTPIIDPIRDLVVLGLIPILIPNSVIVQLLTT